MVPTKQEWKTLLAKRSGRYTIGCFIFEHLLSHLDKFWEYSFGHFAVTYFSKVNLGLQNTFLSSKRKKSQTFGAA